MAREKSWSCVQNVALSGTTDTELAQNWMYEFYSFLSGGAGNATAAWEILSASNATSVGGPGTITGSGDMNWNGGGPHTWWVCRKNILPVTASTTRYIYLTVDLEDADDSRAYFSFDYDAPNFSGQTTSARPAETANNYEKDGHTYREAYDAGNQAYWHGTIDTTGSFYTFSSQAGGSVYPYQGTICCARIETPRTGTVDPFPVFLKVGYDNNSGRHGPWSAGKNGQSSTGKNSTIPYSQGYYSTPAANWTQTGGQAVWSTSGTPIKSSNNNGRNAGFLKYGTLDSYNDPMGDTPVAGEQVDGTYPLLPSFIYESLAGATSIVRGRLPDVFAAPYVENNDGLGGLVTPATGTPEYCVVGDYWFPFSASLLPGA